MMRLRLWHRLSLAFAALLLACCGLSAWLQIRASHSQEQEVVQRLSRSLAEHIAGHTSLIDGGSLHTGAVQALFDKLMVVNPSVELYLLDDTGRIVAHAAPSDHVKLARVSLLPIQRFLAGEAFPILGDDPRHAPNSAAQGKVFSVARLRSGAISKGYVYVVLQGETHDALSDAVGVNNVLRTTLWSMALVTALGLAAGLLAFAMITRRLRALISTVQCIEQSGVQAMQAQLDAANIGDEAAPTHDEITLLQHSFWQMARRLSTQWHELVKQDQQRREMVANISHDLRTPLTSLHGYLETLSVKSATLNEIDRRRYLDTALAQSRKVGKLAQSLFELARLEHGAVKPDKEAFSLPELVQDVFQKFELAAQARQLRLLADIAPGLPAVHADMGMIERVLTNLLDNAIRHTPQGGEVKVALRWLDGQVSVQITDTGPGIAETLRAGLFTRPSILTRSTQKDTGSPQSQGGLGLLIVQRLLQLHSSRIQLLTQPAHGAAFEFGLQAFTST